MSKYRKQLPQLGDRLFVTDGGLETTLVYHEGLDLPCFAAFDLLKDEDGTAILRRYFDRYLEMARDYGLGAVLEAPTWRANASCMSHAELDASTELDRGDAHELARQYGVLRDMLPGLTVLGGCCGTDHEHVDAIVRACAAAA